MNCVRRSMPSLVTGEEECIVAAISADANDYMTKPISLPILRARMAQHLSYARLSTRSTMKRRWPKAN
ncbi:hypothetical protein LWE61_12945 [Sphingobium sufflavum]|nr:hypothetical protein [Sphingobium sufflavum]